MKEKTNKQKAGHAQPPPPPLRRPPSSVSDSRTSCYSSKQQMNKRKNQTKPDILLRSVGSPRTPLPPSSSSFPCSFQLTVEMFDYMDCELKLSESGEPPGGPWVCSPWSWGLQVPQSAGRRGLFTPAGCQATGGHVQGEVWQKEPHCVGPEVGEGRAVRGGPQEPCLQVSDHLLLPRAVSLGQSHPFSAVKGL